MSFNVYINIIEFIYKSINRKRKKDNLGEVCNKSIKTILFDKGIPLYVYLYDLKSSDLLVHGAMGWFKRKDG